MDPPARSEVVLLHLAAHEEYRDGAVAPAALSPSGIADAVGLDTGRIDEHLSLLASLDELQGRGLVEEVVREVEGAGGRRTVYVPTAAGVERAADLRADLSGEEVVVADGTGTERVPVERAEGFFEADSLVDVLARLDEEGRLPLEDTRGGGLVGREAELERVEDALAAVPERGSRTLLVVGAAGVGKTALLEAVAERASDRSFEVLRGTCRPDVLDPYGPLRRAFADAFGDDVLEALAAGAGEDLEDDDAFEAGRNALFYEVREALTERATERPLLVAVDDLQWADQPTLELFVSLAESITEWIYPVLFVGAYRPEAAREDDPLVGALRRLRAADRVERLHLEPLDVHGTRTLIGRLSGDPGVPGAFVDEVQAATGGNPLFVRAVVSRLLDEGVVDPAAGEYPTEGDALDVPTAVRDAVEERLASLDEDGRRVLRAGSVLGETVPGELLVAMVDRPESAVLEYADLLVGAGVWERTDGGFRFDSGVVREAVLASLPDDAAARLHADAAEALETGGEREAALARHFEAAGDLDAALEHYRRAGERAAAMYAHEVSLEAYQSALALAREIDARAAEADLLERLGEVRFLLGKFQAAARAFAELREVTDDPGATVRAHTRSGEIWVKQGEYETALSHAEAGRAVAEGADVPAADLCGLLRMEGWARLQSGDVDAAREAFEREHETAAAAGDDGAVGVALHDLGTVDGKAGELRSAVDRLGDAVDRLEAAGDDRHLAKSLTNLALVHRHLGDLDAAAGEIERALELQRELGDEEGRPTTLLNLGIVQEARGRLAAAAERFAAAREGARRIGRDQKAANAQGDLARVQLEMGALADARTNAEAAAEACAAIDDADGEAAARATLALGALLGGDPDAARTASRRAVALAREVGAKARIGRALSVRGRVSRHDGDLDAAVADHEEGAALMAESGHADQEAENRRELAEDHLAAGDGEAALSAAEAALECAGENAVLRARCRTTLGAALRACGRLDAAEDELAGALATLREREATVGACEARLALAALATDRGDHAAAGEHLDAVADVAAESGLRQYAERCRSLRTELA